MDCGVEAGLRLAEMGVNCICMLATCLLSFSKELPRRDHQKPAVSARGAADRSARLLHILSALVFPQRRLLLPSFLPSFLPSLCPCRRARSTQCGLSLSLSLSSVPSLAPVATPTRTTAITHATATVDHCCRRHRQTGQPAGRLSRAPFDAAPKLGSATETAASSCCVGVASRCAADADAVVVVRAERVDICRLPARCRFHEQPFHIKARYVLQERKSGEAENHLNLSC